MRRTLTVLAATAALLTPAAVSFAAPAGQGPGTNASCSNGKGGNDKGTYNNLGNTAKAADKCGPAKPPGGDGGGGGTDGGGGGGDGGGDVET